MPRPAGQRAPQQADRVEIERLNTTDVRRQIAVSAATAYLALINQKRLVEVQMRSLETARAQLDYNQKRLEGGIGSRLNQLRAAQIASTEEGLVEIFRLNVERAQEALGVLINADGPRDAVGGTGVRSPVIGAPEEWLPARTDYRLFTAERALSERIVARQLERLVADGDPCRSIRRYVTPAGLFQPSGTWRLTVNVAQPVYDGGLRSRPAPRTRGEPAAERAVARPARAAGACRGADRPRGGGVSGAGAGQRPGRGRCRQRGPEDHNHRVRRRRLDEHRGDRRAALGAGP